jgi:hypothetical protein
MAELVYILCTIASLLCAFILFRAYLRNRVRFLLWSSLCFIGFAINNIVLFTDLILLPEINLSFWRLIPALLGLLILIYGLIWDTV